MGYSTKRSNRHFLRAMLSRSISSVNHTTHRHEFSIPALCLPATGRWASDESCGLGRQRTGMTAVAELESKLMSRTDLRAVVLMSPTGSGKTLLAQTLARVL